MLRRLLLLFSCAVCLAADLPADIAYTKTLRFFLKQDQGHYALRSLVSIRQTILTPQGCRHSNLRIPEESHTTVSGIMGRFRGEEISGEKVSYHYPHVEGSFTSPARIHEVEMPSGVKPGDDMTCDYTVVYDEPLYMPLIDVPALNRVDRFTVIVEHPSDVSVDFGVFSPGGDLHPVIDHQPKQTTITFQNLPAPVLLPRNPLAGRHAVLLARLRVGEKAITAHTPDSFCRWYRDQIDRMGAPSAPMKELLASELNAAATPREKARILFDYVKSQVRYIGDEGQGHAFIPYPPADVLAKKWGDCKDKAWLLASLAALYGVVIHPVLISTEFEPEFADVNLGMFNHVICALEDEGRMIFMDPTYAHSEMGDPPDGDLLARGFMLDPQKPRWVVVSNQRVTPSVDVQLQVGLDDPKHGKAKVLLRHGWRADALRARKDLKPLELENVLSNRLSRLLTKISIDHLNVTAEDRETLTLEAEADLGDYFVNTDLRVYVPSTPFRAVSRDLLERDKDTLPIDAEGPDSYHLQIQLQCADLKPRPDEARLGLPGGACFQASCTPGNGTATLDYRYSQPFRIVPEAERVGFLAFCTQYLQLNRKPFQLQRNSP